MNPSGGNGSNRQEVFPEENWAVELKRYDTCRRPEGRPAAAISSVSFPINALAQRGPAEAAERPPYGGGHSRKSTPDTMFCFSAHICLWAFNFL
jgi:hypothetical protein